MRCSSYSRRNTALRCGNPQSFTLSKLLRVFLARLVFLGSKTRSPASRNNAGFDARLIAVEILRYAAATISHLRLVNSLRKSRTLLDLLASKPSNPVFRNVSEFTDSTNKKINNYEQRIFFF